MDVADPREMPARFLTRRRLIVVSFIGLTLLLGAAGWSVRSVGGEDRNGAGHVAYRTFTERLSAGDRTALIELAGQLASPNPPDSARVAAEVFVADGRDRRPEEISRWIVEHYAEIEFMPECGCFNTRLAAKRFEVDED
ncbi:MAG: hypothetical protein IPK83_21460 [Planctomycetes bacterium]|nr:hypothetical protein [Planctomycetota bacterium]